MGDEIKSKNFSDKGRLTNWNWKILKRLTIYHLCWLSAIATGWAFRMHIWNIPIEPKESYMVVFTVELYPFWVFVWLVSQVVKILWRKHKNKAIDKIAGCAPGKNDSEPKSE